MKKTTTIFIAIIATLMLATFAAANDAHEATADGGLGANYTKTYGAADTINAVGGNITTMDVTMDIQTFFWTGFFGNVTHNIVLEGDTSSFYDWTTPVDSTGVVLFANNSNVDWSNLAVSLADETIKEEEDTALGLTGEADSVNNTFTNTNTAAFNVSGLEVNAGDTWSVNTTSTGTSDWETALLHTTIQNDKIYAGVIQQENENYDGTLVDYQAMVPVDSTGTRTYYLYAALG